MKKLVLTLLLGITFGTIYGQGTLCSNSISLPCGTTNFSGTTVGAANNSVAGNCGSDYGQWYSFTGDGTVTTISCTTSGFDPAMQTYSGPCGSLVSVSCVDGAGATGTETYTFTTVLGTEYHVFISYYNQYAPNNSYSGTFRMSRTCPVSSALFTSFYSD